MTLPNRPKEIFHSIVWEWSTTALSDCRLSFTLSDCRLAKFRGLMYNAEYSSVIGWEIRTFVWSQSKSPGYGNYPANHRAAFCVVHQTTDRRNFAKRQCKRQWLTHPREVAVLLRCARSRDHRYKIASCIRYDTSSRKNTGLPVSRAREKLAPSPSAAPRGALHWLAANLQID